MAIKNEADFFREVRKNPERFYIIHYSCQSLYDDNEALSPRVTSIAVTHFATEQTVSFSTHAVAEELNIDRSLVTKKFDDTERELLRRFYGFVQERRSAYWVHWNMRNLTYGFEHINYRYRVLGRHDAAVIPMEQRMNLSDMLGARYGTKYANHPKMTSLMQLNGGLHRHFLDGQQEVEAFKNKEYIKLHNSVLAKVGFFHHVIRLVIKGRLKTVGRTAEALLDRTFESRLVKGVALIGTIVGFGDGSIDYY